MNRREYEPRDDAGDGIRFERLSGPFSHRPARECGYTPEQVVMIEARLAEQPCAEEIEDERHDDSGSLGN